MNYTYANYLPKTKTERMDWLNNFSVQLAQYSATFGFTQEEMDDISISSQWYSYAVLTLDNAGRVFDKAITAFADELDTDSPQTNAQTPVFNPPSPPTLGIKTGIFNRVIALVDKKILPSEFLTPAIKTQLGLDPIAPSAPTAPNLKVPVAMPNGQVELSFSRGGSPMVIIESRRNGGDWELLDKVASTHYLDTRPNLVAGVSESREYRIRYSNGSTGIGQYSNVRSVATQA